MPRRAAARPADEGALPDGELEPAPPVRLSRAAQARTNLHGFGEVARFDPLRLLRRNDGDTHGLDRRTQRRSHVQDRGADVGTRLRDSARLLSAGHQALDLMLGLASAHGWALVRVLSAAPTGLLLHHVDILDPALPWTQRARARRVLGKLATVFADVMRPGAVHPPGSLLGTIGGCLLAGRVMADLSSWASLPIARRGASDGASGSHTVTLFALTADLELEREDLPPGLASLVATAARDCAMPQYPGLVRLEGELVPMTDPQPAVVAVALAPVVLAMLGGGTTRPTPAAPPREDRDDEDAPGGLFERIWGEI
ncbi:MAG: hypothetical protein H6713_23135 [Myxococcales bacterium]|nr:hypothetical protein [Myxococcales bacterium]MCB9752860.1 hypothetical protein [Myxococcales bacterium]